MIYLYYTIHCIILIHLEQIFLRNLNKTRDTKID